MFRSVRILSCLVVVALVTAGVELEAAVKTEQKSQVKFEGMMGRMMGWFGGKAAKEGVVTTVAVKGNRKASYTGDVGEIVDLDEEKVYTLDMKKKNYEVVTFAEMRKRLEEAQEKAKKAAREQNKDSEAPQQEGKQMEIDFSLKESGQKRNINGFDCREVIMAITAREKGKTLEQAGGMVMTSNIWLAPRIAAMKETEDFDVRYMKQMAGPAGFGSAEQMAMALAMYPGMKDMMGKMQAEKVNMDGTAVLTVMTMEAVPSKEQMAQQQKQAESSESSGGGGIGGLLGRKIFRKKEDSSASQDKSRATIMTMNSELLRVTPDVADSDLAVPAGFKQKK